MEYYINKRNENEEFKENKKQEEIEESLERIIEKYQFRKIPTQ